MANVIINDTNLTAIGDSLRDILGETKTTGYKTYPNVLQYKGTSLDIDDISSTSVWCAVANTTAPSPNQSGWTLAHDSGKAFYRHISIPVATTLRITVSVNYNNPPTMYIAPGLHEGDDTYTDNVLGTVSPFSSEYNIIRAGGLSVAGSVERKVINIPDNKCTFGILDAVSKNFGYYMEIMPVDADGNDILSVGISERNEWKPSEMAAAIDSISTLYSYLYTYKDIVESKVMSMTNFTDSRLTKIAPYAFKHVHTLQQVHCANVTEIGDNCFENDYNLTTIDLPKLELMGSRAFANCSGLTGRLEFPNLKYINEYAFMYAGDGNLELIFPALEGSEMFYCNQGSSTGNSLPWFGYADGVSKIDLGEKLDMLQYYGVLRGCTALKTLILRCPTGVVPVYGSIISSTNLSHYPTTEDAYVYVPSALIDAYRADSNWGTLDASKFRAIEDYPDICN